jgi:ribonuclease HI
MPGRRDPQGNEIPPRAGWGFAVLNSREGIISGGFGPVETLPGGVFHRGAKRATNNSAELLAIGFGMDTIVLLANEDPIIKKVVIVPDSRFAAQISAGVWTSRTPHLWDLVDSVKNSMFFAKRAVRIEWKVVPGHAGIYGNEVAHILADWGRRGFFSWEIFNGLLPVQLLSPKPVCPPSTDPSSIAEISHIFPEWLQFLPGNENKTPASFVYGLGWQINEKTYWASFIVNKSKIVYLEVGLEVGS